MRKRVTIGVLFAGLVGIYCWGWVLERGGSGRRGDPSVPAVGAPADRDAAASRARERMDYPGFDEADEEIVERIRRLWPRWDWAGGGWNPREVLAGDEWRTLFPDGSGVEHDRVVGGPLEHIARAIRRIGPDAAVPALRVAVQRYRERKLELSWTLGTEDNLEYAPFVAIAEFELLSINETLLALLRDDWLPADLRVGAIVALCHDGNTTALDPLCEFALDRQRRNRLRRAVLYRLPRLGAAAPKALRALLFEPFGNIDRVAAATLARMGDLEAPSLIVEAIDHQATSLATEAIESLATEAIEHFAFTIGRHHFKLAAQACCGHAVDRSVVRGLDGYPEALRALRGWLKEHPEALETDFEEARAQYLNSERRKRELAIDSLERAITTADGDFDFAATALLYDPYESDVDDRDIRRARRLEQLWRLSEGLRRRLTSATDADGKIEVLTSYLLNPLPIPPYDPDGARPESFLQVVLDQDSGNCLGYTSLFIAMAERLDLPLRPVRAPKHVFVRYDDGQLRCNLELTARGKRMSDEEIVEQYGIERELVAAGVFLADCTKRQLLADVFVNLCAGRLERREFDAARARAEDAMWLDPLHASPYVQRAAALWELHLDPTDTIVRDLDRLLDLRPDYTRAREVKMSFLSRAERYEEAVRAMEGVERPVKWSGTGGFAVSMAWSLTNLRRFEEALATLDAAEKNAKGHEVLRAMKTSVLLQADRRAEAISIIQTAKSKGVTGSRFWQLVAEMLIEQELFADAHHVVSHIPGDLGSALTLGLRVRERPEQAAGIVDAARPVHWGVLYRAAVVVARGTSERSLLEGALVLLKAAAEQQPDLDARERLNLDATEERSRDREKASYLLLRALVHARLGDTVEARRFLLAAEQDGANGREFLVVEREVEDADTEGEESTP